MNCPEFVKKHAEETEEIIMKWAEEHPVQTRKDKFEKVFGTNIVVHGVGWWDEEYKAPTEEVSE